MSFRMPRGKVWRNRKGNCGRIGTCRGLPTGTLERREEDRAIEIQSRTVDNPRGDGQDSGPFPSRNRGMKAVTSKGA